MRRNRQLPRPGAPVRPADSTERRPGRLHPAGLGLVVASLLAGGSALAARPAAPVPLPVFDQACASDDPYFATSLYERGNQLADPAVVAFHDSPNDSDHHTLATQRQVGATWGQAYAAGERVYYVAAFHKRGTAFASAGPGGIYRIDLASGTVAPWVSVPNAGPDRHDAASRTSPDVKARDYAGKTSLGDIDLTPDGTTLYVTNLADRRIYRYDVATKRLLDSFDHGAAGEPWAEEARPFALAIRGGKLFHAVTRTAFASQDLHELEAIVYESDLDGTNARIVSRFSLDYPRGLAFYIRVGTRDFEIPGEWRAWKDGYHTLGPDRDDRRYLDTAYPQPLVTDIEFTAAGDMVLGLRDRYGDMGFNGPNDLGSVNERPIVGVGDIVLARHDEASGTWIAQPAPEFYHQDAGPGLHAIRAIHNETDYGGLARVPAADTVVMTALDPLASYAGGAIWFDNATGGDLGREDLYEAADLRAFGKANGLGDLEVLCPSETVETATPTATPVEVTPSATMTPPGSTPTSSATAVATSTVTPSATATVTDTPTPRWYRIYLPFTSKAEICVPDAYHTDVVLVLDRSTSMLRAVEEGGLPKNEAAIDAAKAFLGTLDFTPDTLGRHDQVAVVGFNDAAWTEQDLTNDAAAAVAALEALRTKTQEGTRLDLAMLEGQKPLDGPHRKPENKPVIILLTDGLPNRVPTPAPAGRQEDTVLAAAAAAKARGTRVYTIGLGKPTDILPRLMWQMASEKWMYYYVPRPEALSGIYAQLAHTFDTCGPQVWPTPTPCEVTNNRADIVLVLDMSTSMLRLTRGGRTKQQAALDAAKTFLAELKLEPDGWGRQDQAAVVGFNGQAWIQQALSDDRALLNAALDALPRRSAAGTRLDLAFTVGQQAIEDPRRLPENRAILILMTDGLPNMVPTPSPVGRQEDTVLAAAAAAQQKGTWIYTVGLGAPEDIDKDLLTACASAASEFYYAPDGEDLAEIYRQIAGRITECRGP